MDDTQSRGGAKQTLWRVGLYLAPFAFALVLLRWGNLFPAWLVIVFSVAVIVLFSLAGFIHVKERGFRDHFHENPVLYVVSIALLSCVVLGTVMYLAMRPAWHPPLPPSRNTADSIPLPPPTQTASALHPTETKPSKNRYYSQRC